MKILSNRNCRRGYLMLDLLIVMTLTAVVLSTTSIWVYKTMQYSSEVRQRDLHARNISRISRQLRTDVRDASSLAVEDDRLVIKTENGLSITYAIKTDWIHREVTLAGPGVSIGGVAAEDYPPIHRDDFEFARTVTLSWNEQSEEAVALHIGRLVGKQPAAKDKSMKLDAQIVVRTAEDSE